MTDGQFRSDLSLVQDKIFGIASIGSKFINIIAIILIESSIDITFSL